MSRTPVVLLAAAVACFGTSCVQAQAPTDTGDTGTAAASTTTPGTPTTPGSTSSTGPFAYNPDVKAILDGDCLTCHGPRRADAGYSVATYAQTMRAVRAGSSSSTLVTVTRSGGSMFRYWSGTNATRQAKADMVRTWIVSNNAQETR